MVPAGDEVRAVVTAVKIWSNIAKPLIVTLPDNAGVAAVAVLKFAAVLGFEAECVAVSFNRC